MSSTDVAYSYRRFSSLPQESGDSIRRQTSKTEAWSQRTGVPIDWSLRIDRGLSGFTMENLDLGSLGQFVELVNKGKVRRGSYLVVESLDRLTRGFEQDAMRLILNLTGAGIRIVQLEPHECVFDAKSDSWALMRLIMDLMRGHQESARKSGMIRADREEKRKQARKKGADKVAQRHPCWLALGEGLCKCRVCRDNPRAGAGWHLVEPAASVMRRVIALALAGQSPWTITRVLNADGVAPFGHGKRWTPVTVNRLLTDGRAAGWLQPCAANRKPDGPPVADYYPRLMEQHDYDRLRGMIARRRGKVGAIGAVPNLFAHLIEDASTGHPFHLLRAKTNRRGQRHEYMALQTPYEIRGEGRSPTIAYLPFEYAILSCLAELPAALMSEERAEDVDALRGQLGALERRQAALVAELLAEDSPTLRAVAKALDAQIAEAQGRLELALRKLANAASDALETAKGLIARLYAAEDGRAERLRLREALRSIVTGLRVVVVPRGAFRLVAAQMTFASGRVRDYLVGYRRSMPHRRGGVSPVLVCYGSLLAADGAGETVDLGDAEVVDLVRRQLLAFPVEELPWKELPAEVRG